MNLNIKLRPANMLDADQLLQWRNDEETIRYSHVNHPVSTKEHHNWMREVLKDNDKLLYIAEENSISVGTARAFFNGGVWIVSWTVAPEARGRGIGKMMVGLLLSELDGEVLAEIKTENLASINIVLNLGFKLKNTANNVNHYVFNSD